MAQSDDGSRDSGTTRRGALALILMGVGLVLSYGLLAAQGFLFLLPRRLRPKVRWLFAGRLDQYREGAVRKFTGLDGTDILIKRNPGGIEAFSSVCPHLGCRVHWVPSRKEFFCPCHNAVFDGDGVAVSGPPADAGQRLARVPLSVDEASEVVYVGVKDAGRG